MPAFRLTSTLCTLEATDYILITSSDLVSPSETLATEASSSFSLRALFCFAGRLGSGSEGSGLASNAALLSYLYSSAILVSS